MSLRTFYAGCASGFFFATISAPVDRRTSVGELLAEKMSFAYTFMATIMFMRGNVDGAHLLMGMAFGYLGATVYRATYLPAPAMS